MPSIGVRLAATTDAQLDCVWLAVYFWTKVSRIKRLSEKSDGSLFVGFPSFVYECFLIDWFFGLGNYGSEFRRLPSDQNSCADVVSGSRGLGIYRKPVRVAVPGCLFVTSVCRKFPVFDVDTYMM